MTGSDRDPTQAVGHARPRASNSDLPIPDEERGLGNAPLLLSLAPFVLFALLYFVFAEYGGRAFREAPNAAPMALRLLGLFIGLAWGGLGSFLVSESSSFSRAVLALLACTLPSSIMVVAAPGW